MATEPLVNADVKGHEVQMTLPPIADELQTDFDAWENLGDEAWGLIAEWEKEV